MALIAQDLPERADYPGAPWHKHVLADIAQRLRPPSDFPCTFSQNAFQRGLLLFSFVDGRSGSDLASLRADLCAYVRLSRAWDGRINHAHPLVVAFSRQATGDCDLAGFHAFGWHILQDWHDNDPAPWPDGVARNPQSPFWSMCFDGMPLFVNMSAPAHLRRKSRNLGDHFLFVVNPRERFDLVAGDTPEGRRVRALIRARAGRYDGMPHAPVLGAYHAGDLEWPQYGVADDNDTRIGTCPFRQNPESR